MLRDLPEWFGIEEATRQYIEDAATLPTLAVDPDLGFLCLKQHTPRAAEIYVMGVRRAQHRKGIGRALVAAAESWCRVRGIPYLHVKTLGPSRPDPGYDATRSFYEAVGFVALEELHGLWDENNPTLVLVKDVQPGFTVTPVEGLPELREGDDLAALIAERTELADGDVVVVAQKAVSKVEGQVVALAGIEPSEQARELAGDEADPRRIQVILDEATELVRVRPPLLIARTRHGYVCGSAGVDASNAPEPETVVLLPVDPDASAARLREAAARADGGRRRSHRHGLVRPAVARCDDGRRDRRRRRRGGARPHGRARSERLRAARDSDRRRRRDRRARPSSSSASSTASRSRSSAASTCAATAGAPTSSSRPRRISSVRTRAMDAIEQANALLRERGYAERDLAVHTGPRGKALLKGNKILSPLSDEAEVVLRVVSELVPTDGELGAKILRPAELRAKL